MGYRSLSSFSTGELDPVLHERTNLAKYNNGLATARNVVIGKSGTALSRLSRKWLFNTKLSDSPVKLYSPPDSGYLIELGHLYIRFYDFTGALLGDTAQSLMASDLPNVQFDTSGNYIYIFCAGKEIQKFNYVTGGVVVNTTTFAVPPAPTVGTLTANGSPSGYNVDYAITYIKSGEESLAGQLVSGKLPIAAGTSNTIKVQVSLTADPTITEMRVYRRPQTGGAYGFIGSTTYFFIPSGTIHSGQFEDIGQAADYTNQPPASVIANQTAPIDLHGKTGIIYQQRLLVTSATDLEAIFASRPAYQNNFLRDFPLDSDSALNFKCGTSGTARVLRMIDADGLVAFTSAGVFINTGALSPTNITMDKKGKWKINELIQPLAVPGGVLFVDVTTNTIRNLVWSTELASYNAQEVTIFSNHLFQNRAITSWAFHEGVIPLLWVTFDDGTFASFTYEFDQEMRAWTRHDSVYPVEQVCGTGRSDITFFLTVKGSIRQVEMTVPRQLPAVALAADPQADKQQTIAAMDGLFSYSLLLQSFGLSTLSPIASPTDPNYYSTPMTLDCGSLGVFTSPGFGAIGQVFRYFDTDGSAIDLTVTARTNNNTVTVTPNLPFPRAQMSAPRLYICKQTVALTGMLALEGESVSVVVDGYIVASPNNDVDGYPTITVASGMITLPNSMWGAIIHIGRPFTADIQTLDIDTMDQAPTLIESITVNKLYMKVFKSAGIFVGASFNTAGKVSGMQSIDVYDVDYSQTNPIIGNRYTPPRTKRVEVTLPGDWKSHGRIAIRQVDPIHFQVLSIIPDIEKLERTDR